MLAWAFGIGAQHRDTVYDGGQPSSPLWKLANKLVYSKVQRGLRRPGPHLRLRRRAARHRHGALVRFGGHRLWEGYGLTETSPVIALNSLPNHRMGAVGKPLPNVELKFAEDGELLVRGAVGLFRLLAQAGGERRVLRRRWLVPHRRHRPSRRTMAFSTSPIARRNC